ncbi:MAG: pyridoxamine 5'-phosphate oxidase [Cytophagales bacterium]|nr:MAG: pyridoxamine 5'-phosphate oxidase [Cytophagales bacterium]
MNTDIAAIRKEYSLEKLEVSSVKTNPMEQFQDWFSKALSSQILEPTAMHLATVGDGGKPSGRIVLLKGIDSGFLFFTNYESRKGREIENNPFASLTFFWAELERQVRIEGKIEKISAEDSDAYFQSRPKGSQIGAIASVQSQVIESREVLEQKMQTLSTKYENELPPRPLHWGGYRLLPEVIEFWQGRQSRLHDRIRYSKELTNWKIERLSP